MGGRDADLLGYTLADAQGEPVGPIGGFWLDAWTARPAFASVALERDGPTRVVPLEGADLDEERRVVRVPFTREAIRDAPAAPADHPLSGEEQRRVLEHYRPGGASAPDARPAPGVIPLHEERVELGKRVVRSGGVRLRKVVRTKVIHQPVEVRYEEIVLERVDPEDAPRGPEGALPTPPFREGSLFVPEWHEEPVVARRTSEVVGGVRATMREETVTEDVPVERRREDVVVDRLPPREDDD